MSSASETVSGKEFVQRCRDEQLSVDAESLHVELYNELVKLDKANKNGVWARIIKNAFAPLFVGQVDYVAGNPPWVRWGYLPKEYREASVGLWKKYGLFSLRGFEARLGSGEKDLSQLFVYACIDNYLGRGGRLGFLITQTVFKAKGQAEGFRRFRLGLMGDLFAILGVNDFSNLKPFEGASNLTVSFVAEKGKATKYPVPYTVWTQNKRERTSSLEQSLDEVAALCHRARQQASPVDKVKRNSQWQTASKAAGQALTQMTGASSYKAKIGARTDPYGVFQVKVLKQISKNLVLVENCADAGKTELDRVQMPIETDLLFPLIRGRDVGTWSVSPEVYVLMVQDPVARSAIPEKNLEIALSKGVRIPASFQAGSAATRFSGSPGGDGGKCILRDVCRRNGDFLAVQGCLATDGKRVSRRLRFVHRHAHAWHQARHSLGYGDFRALSGGRGGVFLSWAAELIPREGGDLLVLAVGSRTGRPGHTEATQDREFSARGQVAPKRDFPHGKGNYAGHQSRPRICRGRSRNGNLIPWRQPIGG